MAADDFTLVPTRVETLAPEYNNLITPYEGMKKQYQALTTTPIQRFKLIFTGISDTNFDTLVAHYHGRYGGYDSFSWNSVPSYIDTDLSGSADGTNMTGRWVDGSLIITRVDAYSRDVEIIFEKDV